MAGRGRGRGSDRKKRKAADALSADPSGAPGIVAEETASAVPMTHAARSMMMTTPLGTLMRIEATIWMNARGGGSMMLLDDFYALVRTHEWLGLVNNHNIVVSNGGKDGTKMASILVSKQVSTLSHEVYELITQLSEEERLLLDFLAVSAWESHETTTLHPLYRFHSSLKGNIQLEMLQQPQPPNGTAATATTKTNIQTATRSEILGKKYHHSRKYFSFDSTTVGSIHALPKWWEHAKSVAQMILDHRESMAASISNVKVDTNDAAKSSVKSLVTNNTPSAVVAATPTKNGNEKKTTLEERVRARSLRNPTAANSKQASKVGGASAQVDDTKCLLELADALRSYSQRRGLVSSGGGGGSALDRLRNRGATGTQATKNIARLTVMDLMKDARMTWSAVVHESVDQRDSSIGGSKSRRGGATPVVTIDLGRVLFQLRLKMVTVVDVSDKRQMELQLFGLLEKLATLAPAWIHLRRAPSTLTGTTRPVEKKIDDSKWDSGVSTNQKNATTSNLRLNIQHSIIVIRNDSVDYATIRAKLGGRVHNPVGLAIKSNTAKKTGLPKGNKRSFQQMEEQQLKNKIQVGAADAIVPPSFRRMYGKALGLDEATKK